MNEQHEISKESLDELYRDAPLGDAANELSKIFVHEDGTFELLGSDLPVTMEKRYSMRQDVAGTKEIIEAMAANPKKVERYDHVIGLMNKNFADGHDPILHKRYCNEIVRLTQGANKRVYDDPQTDPDLLDF